MIVCFLLSLLAECALVVFVTLESGGTIAALTDPVLLLGMIAIPLGLTLALCGARPAGFLFSRKKKRDNATVLSLNQAERAVDFFVRMALCVGFFFMLSGVVLFYYNMDIRTTMGPNLAMVILSPLYAVLLALLVMPLRGRIRRRHITCMAEAEPRQSAPKRRPVFAVMRAVLAFALVVCMVVVVMRGTAVNERLSISAAYFIDMPALVIMLFAVPQLAIGGVLADFGRAFAAAVGGRDCTTTERHLAVNAFSLARGLLLCDGIAGTLGGFVAILSNLRDASALAANMFVAMLPSFYATVLCAVLLAMQAKLEAECDRAQVAA